MQFCWYYSLIVTVLLVCIGECFSLWWAIGHLELKRVCRRARNWDLRLVELCRNNRQFVIALIQGAKLGLNECEHQFRFHRWNCTEQKKSITKMLLRDTKETAFVHAITASAVAFVITRFCSSGELTGCSCKFHQDQPYYQQIMKGNEEQWPGCGENFDFGYEKSKEFMDVVSPIRQVYSSIHGAILRHNNEVGRQVIKSQMELKCKCHGLSGSCSTKTCWNRMKSFRDTSQMLFEKFSHAKLVSPANDGSQLLWALPAGPTPHVIRRSVALEDLVFVDHSPNFCRRNRRLGILGTRGRECDSAIGDGFGSCDWLCCRRGFQTHFNVTTESCNCTLQHSAQRNYEVICNQCVTNLTQSFCA